MPWLFVCLFVVLLFVCLFVVLLFCCLFVCLYILLCAVSDHCLSDNKRKSYDAKNN